MSRRPLAIRHATRRIVSAVLSAGAAAGAVACAGDPVDPAPAPSLTILGPVASAGQLVRPADEPAARRFECSYGIQVIAGRTPFPLGGATLTIQPWTGGDLPVAIVHEFSAAEVAEWLGTSTLGANRGVPLTVTTSFTFVPTTETFGDTGAHRATWAFAYGTAGDSARHRAECTAATENVFVQLVDPRRGPIPTLPVEFDGRALRTSRDGFVSLPPLVAGRYRLRVIDPLYAPLDTLLETGGGEVRTVRLTRVRPEVEAAVAALDANAPAGGAVIVYHPAGVGALPPTLGVELHDSSSVPARVRTVAAAGTDLDAGRRRYAFAEHTWGTTHIVVALPLGDGATMVASCRRFTGGPWLCADRWPAPGEP